MKKSILENYGSSLLEIVIALSVFLIVSASLAGVILGSFNVFARSDEIVKADNLANSGVEMVRAVRDRAWNELRYGTSSVVIVDGIWQFSGEGTIEYIDGFTRKIEFFNVYRDNNGEIVSETSPGSFLDIYTKDVLVTVGWSVMGDQNSVVERESRLSNWNSFFWGQSDFSGGSGQAEWSDETKFAESLNIQIINGDILLEEISSSTYASSGYLISSAFNINASGNFNGIEWEEDKPNNTNVSFQIKTAPDNNGSPGEWSLYWSGPNGDEDGGENDYFTISTGELINLTHNNDEWIKYKAMLNGDGVSTPAVRTVKINYSKK